MIPGLLCDFAPLRRRDQLLLHEFLHDAAELREIDIPRSIDSGAIIAQSTVPVHHVASTTKPKTRRYHANGTKSWLET